MSTRSIALKLNKLVHSENPLDEIDSIRELSDQLLGNLKASKLNNISPKRKEQNQTYSVKRREFLAAHRHCQVEGCKSRTTDIHHMRKRNGDRLLDERYWMAVCRPCHDKITNNPEWAFEMGYCFPVNYN